MRTSTILTAATGAAAALLLAGCNGLANADDPVVTDPGTAAGAGAVQDTGATSDAGAVQDTGATSDASATQGPTAGAGSPLPPDYPWESRQSPPPQGDVEDGGEPWIGGVDTVVLPEYVEVLHDGEPTYTVTDIEIYEAGPDQSRAVVSYEGGDGRAGLNLSVAGATDFPPEVTIPGGVDTGLAFLTGAQAPLGGGLEPGQLVRPASGSRIHGVSVGPPDPAIGTGIYVGMDAGAVLWAVADHPGTLVLIVTDAGTGPTS